MIGFETASFDHAGIAHEIAILRPAGTPRGAVLVCPTIANRNAAMDRRARMLADAGFVALIADFYGGAAPEGMDGRMAAGRALMADTPRFRAVLAANLAQARHTVGEVPFAAIGFCMGGKAVLELARDGADIRAAISFHGLLATDTPAPRTIAPVILVCHGDADPMAPREHVAAFEAEMDAAQAQWQLMVFGGARHGFTDPEADLRGNPALAYDARADRQSWSAAMLLLDEVFA